MNEDEKVNIHAALEMFTSGQLLFLGLKINQPCIPGIPVFGQLTGSFTVAAVLPG